jgi:hypothetical protein
MRVERTRGRNEAFQCSWRGCQCRDDHLKMVHLLRQRNVPPLTSPHILCHPQVSRLHFFVLLSRRHISLNIGGAQTNLYSCRDFQSACWSWHCIPSLCERHATCEMVARRAVDSDSVPVKTSVAILIKSAQPAASVKQRATISRIRVHHGHTFTRAQDA